MFTRPVVLLSAWLHLTLLMSRETDCLGVGREVMNVMTGAALKLPCTPKRLTPTTLTSYEVEAVRPEMRALRPLMLEEPS